MGNPAWVKGKSPNPEGRPRGQTSVEAFRRDPDLFLAGILKNGLSQFKVVSCIDIWAIVPYYSTRLEGVNGAKWHLVLMGDLTGELTMID